MPRLDPATAYRVLAPRVLGYLRGQGAAEPEDLLGEVFLQVARDEQRFAEWDDPESVRRWVFTIARNRAIDDGRHRRRRPQVVDVEVPDHPAPTAPPIGTDPALLAALQQLTEDQREVVVLRFVADLPLEEVAVITKRNVGAVKALQHRALENLRAAVSPRDAPSL